MSPAKCDADGNLYVRKYASDRPLLGPIVKLDSDGKRTAMFDPTAFSQLGLIRADAFSPASDGGVYQIAQSGDVKPRIYVLHFSSDGSPSSPALLDADFEVYTFAAFPNGNLLVSGLRRDPQNKNDHGQKLTAVFSADGRELAQLSFEHSPVRVAEDVTKQDASSVAPTLDLADAEVGSNGNLYVLSGSSPVQVYAIAPSGKILKALKVASPAAGLSPSAFHVSLNRFALAFWDNDKQKQMVVVADAETGEKIATYQDSGGLSPSFACYSANDSVFTFLMLGEGNALNVIRARPE